MKALLRLQESRWPVNAAIFDLAAFRRAMIAPVKKSVNHSKTVTSMREMRMIRRAILSVATRLWKTNVHLANVYLLLNQDRWNEVSGFRLVRRAVSIEIASDMF